MESNGPLRYVELAEAAAALGVSEWAVLQDCEAGRLPAERIATPTGQTWRVLREALNRQNPPPPPATRTAPPVTEPAAVRESDAATRTAPLVSESIAVAESALLELSREVAEVKAFIAGKLLPRLEKQISSLHQGVEALAAQVQVLVKENARLHAPEAQTIQQRGRKVGQ